MYKKNKLPAFFCLLLCAAPAWFAGAQTATDVNCSKCVDTSDIAANAITTGRIQNGAVTNADLALDAITSNRIRDGTVSNADLAPDAITSSRIKNGSITNADIATNNITGSRIKNGSLTGVDVADGSITGADVADGSLSGQDLAANSITAEQIADGAVDGATLASDAVFQSIYLVRADLFDAAASCQKIRDVLAVFPDANTDRALIKLEPGVYDCSTGGAVASGLVMKPFVDIEGSGQGVTVIQGDSVNDGEGVVLLAANSELRRLTVDNIAEIGTHALYVPEGGSVSFVTLDAATGNGANEVIDCGSSSTVPELVVRSSIVRGADQATFDCGNGLVFVATHLDVQNGLGTGGHICHASFDAGYAPLDSNCAGLAAPMSQAPMSQAPMSQRTSRSR